MDTSNPTKGRNKAPIVDIQQELQATSFGKQRDQSITGIISGKLLNLTVDKVHTYDRNPRREDNPEHEQIKSSIRQRGMDQVLSVTQRPNGSADKFMIIHGGNTRLEILKELFEETKDPKFGSLQCRYVAWESESDAIIGHLIENDARGDYSFIDRAIGVRNSKQELEKETGKKLSDRSLITTLHEQGYKLSRIDLFRMNYAVDVLYPAMPEAMKAGIGPWQIDAIRKLQKHSKEIFIADCEGNESEWGKLFHNELVKQNDENWSYDDLYSDVLLQLAKGNSTEANHLSFILTSKIEGLENDKPQSHAESNSDHPTETEREKDESQNTPSNDPDRTDNDITTPTETASEGTSASEVISPTIERQTEFGLETFAGNESTSSPSTTADSIVNTTPKDLRSKLFTQALQLASNNGYGELVTPLPSLGAGFIIKDLPSESYFKGEQLFGVVKKRPYKERIMVWWMLFGFSELRTMALNKPEIIDPVMPEGELRNILLNDEAELKDKRRLALAHIFQKTGEFIIDDLSFYFWAVASEKNLAQIQEMQRLYRQLNEVLDFNLWEAM